MRYPFAREACSNREQEKPAKQKEVCLGATPGELNQANYQKWRFKQVQYAETGDKQTNRFEIQMKWHTQDIKGCETLDTVARQLVTFKE